ncbi:MAG: hypothetical protein HUU35_05435 [Armatimonadetes bacterium]|nr:hypothetical protein [Armatimonadota bacterium]
MRRVTCRQEAPMMTCRERIVAAFEHRESDRVPAYDLLRNEGAIAHYAGQPVTPENWEVVVPRAISRCLDMTRSVRGPSHESRLENDDGSVQVVERWTTWHPVKRFRDESALADYFRRVADGRRPAADDLARVAAERIAWHVDWQARLTPTVQIWQLGGVGLMGAHGVAGLELFSYVLHDDPSTVGAYLTAVAERHVELVHAVFRQLDPELKPTMAPVAFVGDDIAYKNGPMFSLPMLREHFFPHLRRICDAYHEHGIWVMFHSDGDLNPLMDDFVAAGIDGLNPIERNANMDLAPLKERYGARLTFCGGVDIHRLMRHGSLEEVVAGTRQAILEAGCDGGYLCGSSTELDDGLPPENVIAMLETIRTEGGYRALVGERP